MADWSVDASNIEQLVTCICWVDKEMTVTKEYIDLMLVTQTNAYVPLHMNLRIQDAYGQCYGGCLAMTET